MYSDEAEDLSVTYIAKAQGNLMSQAKANILFNECRACGKRRGVRPGTYTKLKRARVCSEKCYQKLQDLEGRAARVKAFLEKHK